MKNYLPRPDLLAGRVILVTGASSGLGRAASLAFARHGATVALLARNEAKLEAVYDAILAAGGPEPAMFPYDLAAADDRSLETLAGTLAHHLKRLDGLLHSAHQFYSLTPLHLQTTEQWQTLMRVNLIAPFALTRACLPLLRQAPDASVVFTGETHGHQPSAYWGGYAVAKSGLETLTRIWADELSADENLRINTLIPGQVATTLRSRTHPGLAPETIPGVDDLMPWYLYLIGLDSRSVRGQIVECQA
ncbi:SDR family NAD(P)-dependent oxidoreductase [Thiobacillus sp. 65-1402]|uniref:SDR family NAD(P)-dependent oxidoreductase n=1 Tax=Thiobacillus sp. 65-1402 TaxID=1895861 RepID=UPI000968AA71|nr:SDR family NAD(P)-dependent oxidoreductase [Thiobacillus sp. 65-1402]OJW83600.1 MAG: NAD(P)-dependent oxidoreductase [Thiobacillus sp. 65-1402]OZA27403.1 MAG: NAD(P)-dependent oxidoreductase [Hydrogenophilales bacterium 17-64-11]